MDVREMNDLFRQRFAWIHERDIPIHDCAVLELGRCNLDKFVMGERKTSRFGIDHNNVAVENTEV